MPPISLANPTQSTAPHFVAAGVLALLAILLALAAAATAYAAPGANGQPPVDTRQLRVPNDRLVVMGAAAGKRLGAAQPHDLVYSAEKSFTAVGLVRDSAAAAGSVIVRYRASCDGRTWQPWQEVSLERGGEDGVGPAAYADVIWTGPAKHLRVQVRAVSSRAPLTLSGARIVVLDTGVDDTPAERAATALRAVGARLAALTDVDEAQAAVSKPAIVTRKQWGANESWRGDPPNYATVKMAFIHHTAGNNTYTAAEAPSVVRAIYAYHTKTLGWNDIGYNFLIDRYGKIYEGRYGGVTKGVIGAQVYGFNTGSTGVSIMGTYGKTAPPAATLASLQRLLAWKLPFSGVNPSGKAKLTCGATDKYKAGAAVTFSAISGHRNANYTDCPGDALHAELPTIRSGVSRLLSAASISTPKLSSPVFSPNGDGQLDKVTLQATTTGAAKWSVAIRNAGGTTVRSLSGTTSAIAFTWNGKTSTGARLADGTYTATITAASVTGERSYAHAKVRLDTVAPKAQSVALSRSWLSPEGDGWADTTSYAYTPSETCQVKATIRDAGGATKYAFNDWATMSSGKRRTATWGGLMASSAGPVAAPEGKYSFRVYLRDRALNVRKMVAFVNLEKTISSATSTPIVFSPNGDGANDTVSFGFVLARTASLRATAATKSGATVRTVNLGRLSAGKRNWRWNGRTSTGAVAASGRYALVMRASTGLGATNVKTMVTLDNYKPRITPAASRQTVLVGSAAKIAATASDPYSGLVRFTCTVVNARGNKVAVIVLPRARTGVRSVFAWTPTTKGTYTLTFRALDLGGNREYRRPSTTLVVK